VRTLLLATLVLFITEDNILTSNAQQHATGASSSGNWVTQVAAFRGTATTFSGSVGIAGPRSYVDVTAYGAKGINTDDTAAIQAAITAACATTVGGLGLVPQLYFPPGFYGIAQPQLPSTASGLNVPCALEFVGGGGTYPQFETQPVADIAVIPGARPNGAALVGIAQNVSGVTVDHLLIDGYNEAFSTNQNSNIRVQDSFLRVQATGLPDNAPLVETNTLWFFMNGGGLGFNNSNPLTFKNLYDVEFLGKANASGDISYLQFFTNVTAFGGGFLYDQRTAPKGGEPCVYSFDNVSLEDSANPFFTVASSTSTPAGMCSVTFNNDLIEDSLSTTPQPIFYFNQSAGASGITVNHSAGAGGPAIVQGRGSVTSYNIFGCNNNCSQQAVDASGNPLGSGFSQTIGGLDFVSNVDNNARLVTDYAQLGTTQPNGVPVRLFSSGSGGGYAALGLDSVEGVVFGNGVSHGWTAQIVESAQRTLDIGFSTTVPPTGVTATPARGGTLANGTYYYFVAPQFGVTTCGSTGIGAPSLVSTGATTTNGKNQVNIAWSLPPAAPTMLAGFCVFRTTSPSIFTTQTGIFVSGGTSTRVTDTGSNFGTVGDFIEVNHMQAFHRFTPTSMGIGTLNPLFNADIRGSIGAATYNTQTNCSSSASPAACASASAGSVTVAASATTEVVNTTAITASSQVLLTFDSSLGTKLGVTCNTTAVQGTVSARTAGTSFTINLPTAPIMNPACFSYDIVN
jgi:hypothetical protein